MQISVISDHQSTVIVHPPEAAFNDPTPAVSLSHTDGSATTGFAAFSLNGGNGGFDPPSAQPNSKRTAVISFVSHQFLGPCSGTPPPLRDPNRFQGGFRQPDFMMPGAVQIQTDRHPVSIRYHHNLGSLAHLGFSNPVSPFLAGTNRPSRKAWDHSIFSSASIRLNSARQIRSHVPSSDHCFNRRQQVVGEPYCRGMSAQVQPVFKT